MIYTYHCEECKRDFERVCSLAAYVEDPTLHCRECGKPAVRVLTPVRIFSKGNFEPFVSPVDGSVITTSTELQEHNKRNNVVNLHDGYDEAAVKKFTEQRWNQAPEEERKKDLNADMEKAIQKLEEGYKPSPAEYTEEIPNG